MPALDPSTMLIEERATTKKVRVAINGYGVIGKRVADAVAAQDDMELVGVADASFDYRLRVAAERGFPIYAALADRARAMQSARFSVGGSLDDLRARVDIVVDCTPTNIGVANKPAYERAGVRAIFQGGESHEFAGLSFVTWSSLATSTMRSAG